MPRRRKPQLSSTQKPERRSARLRSTPGAGMPDSADPIPSPPPTAADKPDSADPLSPKEASPAAKPGSSTDPITPPPPPKEASSPATAADPDSTDPTPSRAPEEAVVAAKPDLDMPPRRSIGGCKLKKPLTDKFLAAAEARLVHLRVNLRIRPLDPLRSNMTKKGSTQAAALRSLGLLDFARLNLRSVPPRPDLVAQLIAYYDPSQARSFVWGHRISVERTDLSLALSLPKKSETPAKLSNKVKRSVLLSAAMHFMRVFILPAFAGGSIPPQEVADAEKLVNDGSPHQVDWTRLIWILVQKEMLELPDRADGLCYYGAYLQQLIWFKKPELFELPQEEEIGKLGPKVSFDLAMDEQDGDADTSNKGLQELELTDADADVRSKSPKESELEGASLTSKTLDESESEPADAEARGIDLKELESGNVGSKIMVESEAEGVDLRGNGLNESGSGDARGKIVDESMTEAVDLRSNHLNEFGDAMSNILEGSETEGVKFMGNDLKELESEDATAMTLEESEPEGVDMGSNDLKELDSGNVRSMILEELETEGVALRNNDFKKSDSGDAGSKSMEEFVNVDANAMSKSLDTSMVADEDAKGMTLDVEMESGDVVDANAGSKSPDTSKVVAEDAKGLGVEMESGDADANAGSRRSPDTSKVVAEDEKGMSVDDELESQDVDPNASNNGLETPNVVDVDGELELGCVDPNARSERMKISEVPDEDARNLNESMAGDELGLELETVTATHEVSTLNDEISTEFAWRGDEDTFVGEAEKETHQSPDVVLVTQEDEEAEGEEDEDEAEGEEDKEDGEAEGEEDKDPAGWSLGGVSSANDDDSVDLVENASVQNLDDDSDNEEAEESDQDAFEGCRDGEEMNWSIGDNKGGEGTMNSLQRCDFPGMEFENLNKGDVGMRDVVSFDDGYSGKMGSLHGMESTNLLQAMNSIPATYNGTENAHDLSSGDFLAMGADAHKNGVDLGTGSSFFFGNNGKRHIEDIDGYDDQMQTQQQFLQGNQHKRMRNSNSSVSPGSAVFDANYAAPIRHMLDQASMFYKQKEREIEDAQSQKQYMANLLQQKDAIIQSLNSARFEQENKLQAKLRCFEHDLNVMGQLVSGYKRALKQSHASFNEYRRKFPSNKFRYHDVPSGGGLVLSVKELERKRWEEEQQELVAAKEMIEGRVADFQREWFSKHDDWEKHIAHLQRKTEGLAQELVLLKEKRKAKLAILATEE